METINHIKQTAANVIANLKKTSSKYKKRTRESEKKKTMRTQT